MRNLDRGAQGQVSSSTIFTLERQIDMLATVLDQFELNANELDKLA